MILVSFSGIFFHELGPLFLLYLVVSQLYFLTKGMQASRKNKFMKEKKYVD